MRQEKLTEGDVWKYFNDAFDFDNEGIVMRSHHTGGGCCVIEFVYEDDADWHEEQFYVWVTPFGDVFRGHHEAEVDFVEEDNTYSVGCYIGEEAFDGSDSDTIQVVGLEDVVSKVRELMKKEGK